MSPTPTRGFEEPAPHLCLDGFLGEEMVARLLAYTAAREPDFRPTRIRGTERAGAVAPGVRSSRVLLDLGDLKPELESRFAAVMDTAVGRLGMSPIVLAEMELELVAHGDGAFYRRHVDTVTQSPNAGSDRALSGVYYFHRLPKAYSGGELRVHALKAADGVRRFVDVVPTLDTLLLFPAWAPHEVRPVSCPTGAFMDSRFAINCWYRHRRSR